MFQTRTIVAIALLALVGGAVAYKKTRKDSHLRSAPVAGQSPAGAPAPVKADAIDELEIVDAGKPPTQLKKSGTAWTLTAPVADAADDKTVEQALKALAEIEWKDVVAESKESYETLQVRDEDVVRVTAKQAGKPVLVLAIGKSGNVRVGDDARVWSVGKLSRGVFVRETKMWRHRELFRFEKAEVARVEAVLGADRLVATREAAPEALPPPAGAPPAPPKMPAADHYVLSEGQAAVGGALDDATVNAVVQTLSRLDIAEFADGIQADLAGLTQPRATVTVVLTDGRKKGIELGSDVAGLSYGADERELTYARVVGEARIFLLRDATVETLSKPALQWRDKTLAKLDGKDVVELDLVKGAEHLTFERVDDTTWKATTGEVPELDSSRVQSLAGAFANLRGSQIANVSAKDAKAGLGKPTGVVKLWKKGDASPTVTLTIGALDGKTYYVQSAGRPEVFTVPDVTVNRWLKGAADFKKSAGPPPGAGGMPPGMMMPPH